ncbi:alpha-aspartyl dipeptidase-like isoform X1 [Ctenopharyngodon idella]|uniref:alpha-aspartyl dipeptidase-like isoform X1 n=1 Tax=Ctenopharyngodon idella TaxID=7959 RepID=UPI00223119DB|nr:alpha-aspartyl dipeptidase-like isoform X1 [Ctenopharyngodon idella]XP_051760611.1 alpha-aspartyl dipeptidase-like isoform X1 [Ctenopharyngodon idella]
MKRRLLLVSNSTLHGGGYLQHCQQNIQDFFGKDVKRILFVPYALHDRDAYTKTARDKFKTLGYEVDSVHETPDPVDAVRKAEGIFIGGGNTFRLLKALYDNKLVTEIRKRVLQDGIPYMGSSAGTNVSTISINTTNDMPIVYPPTFAAIGLVPFNINPHYLDPDPNSRHMGETREQRITQYHEEPDTPCVLLLVQQQHNTHHMLLMAGSSGRLNALSGGKQSHLTWVHQSTTIPEREANHGV